VMVVTHASIRRRVARLAPYLGLYKQNPPA
jgi:hypothetical protein